MRKMAPPQLAGRIRTRFPRGATFSIVCPRRPTGLQTIEASNNAKNGTSAARVGYRLLPSLSFRPSVSHGEVRRTKPEASGEISSNHSWKGTLALQSVLPRFLDCAPCGCSARNDVHLIWWIEKPEQWAESSIQDPASRICGFSGWGIRSRKTSRWRPRTRRGGQTGP